MSSRSNIKVYMDVQIGAEGAGRIIFQLFNDLTPKTSQNFRGLCSGEFGKVNNTRLHYLNTKIHRISDGFVIQGGDISHLGGKGGYSIYGRTFMDENFSRTHSCAGLLSMANCGRNTNSSQFFITLKACPHLDGKHVVFGQVIDGMQVVRKISKTSVDKQEKPRIPIIIVDCGQVGDYRDFIKFDPFKKEVFDEIRQKKEKVVKDQYLIRKLLSEGMDTNEAYEYKKKLEKCEKDLMDLTKRENLLAIEQQEQKKQADGQNKDEADDDNNNDVEQAEKATFISQSMKEKFGEKNINRFLDLKLKINQAKVLNSRAALDEEIRDNDVNYHKMVKKRDWQQKRKQAEDQLQSKGISRDKLYLNRNATKKQDHNEIQDKKKQQSFGWNVYSQDAYYSAYEKRCQQNLANKSITNTSATEGTGKQKSTDNQQQQKLPVSTQHNNQKPSQQALQRLQADIKKQQILCLPYFRQQKRSLYSRRRMHDQDQTVDYINDRNRVYNQKLERNFKTYASAIKTSLEMNSHKS